MAGEGKEIQMALGYIDTALQRANAITHGVMVVNVTEQFDV
jgi:hypothetical protein